MIDRQDHTPTPRKSKLQWITGNRLRARLLRSHLLIALLGLALLGTALVTVLWTRSVGVRLAELDGPLVQYSMRTLAGLQGSLAGLRGLETKRFATTEPRPGGKKSSHRLTRSWH